MCRTKNVQEIWLLERFLRNLQNMLKLVLWVLMMIFMINLPISTAFYMKNNFWTKIPQNGHCELLKKIHIFFLLFQWYVQNKMVCYSSHPIYIDLQYSQIFWVRTGISSRWNYLSEQFNSVYFRKIRKLCWSSGTKANRNANK